MDFPGNSQNVTGKADKVQQEKKEEVTKVVTTTAIQRKRSLSKRFKEVFLGGEFKSATRYITGEVLLPALKNMIVDATSKGVERVIYGDSAPRRRSDISGRPRFNYSAPTRDPRTRGTLPDQAPPYMNSRRRQTVDDIILISREEADLVIERLGDIVDKYEVASVADLHELVGLPSSYMDGKWGWTSIGYANVRQIREGYLIDLPPVEPI
jgi:hypothetical protein